MHNDVGAMGNLMSEKWIAVVSDGTTIDKTRWVKGMRSGKTSFYKVEFRDEHVIVHDHVAIFVGRFTEKGVWVGKTLRTQEPR